MRGGDPFSLAGVLTRNMPLAADADLAALATSATEGMTGADLDAVCRQAAFNALARTSGRAADMDTLEVCAADLFAAAAMVVPSATAALP